MMMHCTAAIFAAFAALAVNIVQAQTWETGCRNVKRGTLSQLKESSSKPLRPCKAGEVQTTILIEVPGVKFGRREALLTELNTSKVVLERRAVTVTLEWFKPVDVAHTICSFFFASQGHKTSFDTLRTNRDGNTSVSGGFYLDDGQAVELYDMVATFDDAGCYGVLRFRQANGRKNDVGSRAPVRALYSK